MSATISILRNELCDWLWNAHTQLLRRKGMIAAGWATIGILKAWMKKWQMKAMVANNKGGLFPLQDMHVKEEDPTDSTDGIYYGDVSIDRCFHNSIIDLDDSDDEDLALTAAKISPT
ncbi:hypothetical protein R1flu_015784 [Riccia fluitans]|uniref:Uncharacterized protein n=1 Tax=Riccia fluitans TaxID=41844 RepID=A0ABD1YJY0_9MARC